MTPPVAPPLSPQTALRVPMRTKLAFGFGAVAYGIKDNGFSAFLLLFYNQVIGLPAGQVGLAIMIALLVDAFIDPVVGHLSDQTKSKWGRRHPWLYASALPIALCWIALWNPPNATHTIQLIYLTIIAIMVRASLSCYEIPCIALTPQITTDYHERTLVVRYRFLFGWVGGLGMLALANGILLTHDQMGNGNATGFSHFAVIGAVFMVIAVLVSALGTHREYAKPIATTISQMSSEHGKPGILSTLSNRAFLILMVAGICAFTNQGINFALTQYTMRFIWEMQQDALVYYAVALLFGVVLAFFCVAPIGKALGKRAAAAWLSISACILTSLPYFLRLADSFPTNESPLLLPLFFGLLILATGSGVGMMILTTSMMADITEESEAETGRKSEGLFFAGFFFMQKCVTGIGIFISGTILALIGFPENAMPGLVPPAIIDQLSTSYAMTTILIGCFGAWAFTRFPIGRADHERRLIEIAEAQHSANRNTV